VRELVTDDGSERILRFRYLQQLAIQLDLAVGIRARVDRVLIENDDLPLEIAVFLPLSSLIRELRARP